VFDGSVVRLRDAKGLRHLARLNATRAIRAAVANLARGQPRVGAASGRHDPDRSVLRLPPRPARPDRLER
jgi:hypothetical protein